MAFCVNAWSQNLHLGELVRLLIEQANRYIGGLPAMSISQYSAPDCSDNQAERSRSIWLSPVSDHRPMIPALARAVTLNEDAMKSLQY